MKVILLQDINGKGKKDDIIEVAAGFANHLIRENKAVDANKDSVHKLDKQKKEKQKEREALKEQAEKNKKIIEAKPLEFMLKVGEGGRVFKSISHKQIMEKLREQYSIKLDKKKFLNKENINSLGTYNVELELFKGVKATLKVHVSELK
ncbi:50S ribosomal protein L9 [Mycoplasma sp. P36-A1]|uniref:50S ribosomal protein L9 n=1 Tax=Mycoplasma sp. P36-A1 TaxID=3252900 RepID=UPI003C2AB6C9